MRLDKRKFEAWLRARLPDEIVGYRHNSSGCPIANFYYDISGNEVVVADNMDGEYTIDRGYRKTRLPEWAERFARQVDGEPRARVSASRALELLATR